MKLNKFLALAFLLWVSLFVYAQSPVSFTSDQGLSNTCIRSMKQDSRKNVWICTQYGLNRFDGAKMNVYHYKSDEKGSLGHDNTTCVFDSYQQTCPKLMQKAGYQNALVGKWH